MFCWSHDVDKDIFWSHGVDEDIFLVTWRWWWCVIGHMMFMKLFCWSMMLMKIFFWSWSPPSRSIFFKKSSFPRTRAWSGREATVTPLKLVFTAYCCYILFCYFLILMYLICLILFYRSTQWKNEPIANQQRNQRFLTCSPFPFSPLQRTVSCQQLKAEGVASQALHHCN